VSVTVRRQDNSKRWVFDATPTEDYQTSIEITDHPVEEGAKVSDHAEEDPLGVKLEGVVQARPPPTRFRPDLDNRVSRAISFFEDLSGTLVTLTSQELGTFEDMLLSAYPHTIDVTEGTVIQAKFKQVRIATAKTVRLPPKTPPPDKSSEFADGQDAGKKIADKVEEKAKEYADEAGDALKKGASDAKDYLIGESEEEKQDGWW
jgi:hypothetical protein